MGILERRKEVKILIVEDNPTNMKLISNLIKKAAYEVLGAADANAGIAMAREERPDLILMDIQLPGMDGLTATGILKNDEKTRHIPVIALTSYAMKGDEERMTAAGCDGYLAKPIRYKELLQTVESFLREKHP